MRDLCRAREDMVIDRTRARYRLDKFLLRHGRIWRGGSNWTVKHESWIRAQRFDEPAMTDTFNHYLAVLSARDAAVAAIEADLWPWTEQPPFSELVSRFAAYRGITALGGLVLTSEVCDWRRFPTAGMFMGFTGLVPTEHSSGERQHRGEITHAGNTLSGPSWSSRPGRTGPPPASEPSSPNAKTAFIPTPWPARGKPSSVCAAGSGVSTPARTIAK